jgi:hypothetical protein
LGLITRSLLICHPINPNTLKSQKTAGRAGFPRRQDDDEPICPQSAAFSRWGLIVALTFKSRFVPTSATENLRTYYQRSEGIDIRGRELLFVSKNWQSMYMLHLDKGIYYGTSTALGRKESAPDQLQRIGGHNEMLFFTEVFLEVRAGRRRRNYECCSRSPFLSPRPFACAPSSRAE